jgi:hypothetical protein
MSRDAKGVEAGSVPILTPHTTNPKQNTKHQTPNTKHA